MEEDFFFQGREQTRRWTLFFCLGVFPLQQHNEIMKIMFSYSLFLRCELHFDRMFFHFLNRTLRMLWTFHYGCSKILKGENLIWHWHVIYVSNHLFPSWCQLLIIIAPLFWVFGCQRQQVCSQFFFFLLLLLLCCDSTISIAESTRLVAGCKREALTFINFAIDHAWDKITQSTEKDTSRCILGLFPQLQCSRYI